MRIKIINVVPCLITLVCGCKTTNVSNLESKETRTYIVLECSLQCDTHFEFSNEGTAGFDNSQGQYYTKTRQDTSDKTRLIKLQARIDTETYTEEIYKESEDDLKKDLISVCEVSTGQTSYNDKFDHYHSTTISNSHNGNPKCRKLTEKETETYDVLPVDGVVREGIVTKIIKMQNLKNFVIKHSSSDAEVDYLYDTRTRVTEIDSIDRGAVVCFLLKESISIGGNDASKIWLKDPQKPCAVNTNKNNAK